MKEKQQITEELQKVKAELEETKKLEVEIKAKTEHILQLERLKVISYFFFYHIEYLVLFHFLFVGLLIRCVKITYIEYR
jgi:hypothetical protein